MIVLFCLFFCFRKFCLPSRSWRYFIYFLETLSFHLLHLNICSTRNYFGDVVCELFHVDTWLTQSLLSPSPAPECHLCLFHVCSDTLACLFILVLISYCLIFCNFTCVDFGYRILNRSSFSYLVIFKISWLLLALCHFHIYFRIAHTVLNRILIEIALNLLTTIHSFSLPPPPFSSSTLFLWFPFS